MLAIILTALPALALLAIYFVLLGASEESGPEDVRSPFVGAVVIWGVALVVGMEFLSPMAAVQRGSLGVYWIAVIAGAFLLGGRLGALQRGWARFAWGMGSLRREERIFLLGLAAGFALLCLTAVVSPPNNVDSLNLHMPRVVHWAQEQSLGNYAALTRAQLTRPPFAEAAMLDLRVLFGSDRPVALVQWFSLVGCVIVSSVVAARLGASRSGQMVAAAYGASIPLAVLTATNTKNDLVVSLWVVCLAYFAVLAYRRPLTRLEVALAGAAIGLGLMTKGTFQPTAFPFACWLAYNIMRRGRLRQGLASLAILGCVALAINLGFWARNVRSFGTPFGTLIGLEGALEIDDLLPSALGTQGAVATLQPPSDGPASSAVDSTAPVEPLPGWPFLPRAASLLTLHSIYPEVGAPLRSLAARVPGLYAPGFLASLEEGLWNHEDSAGALLHVLLGIAASLWAVVRSVRTRDWILGAFVASTWFGWCLLTLITNSIQLWGIRYQLGFLMLSACLVGVVAGWIRRELALGLALLLLLTAIPYVLLNNTRPLIGAPPRTRSASIFLAPSIDLLFTSTPEVEAQYALAAEWLEASACRQIGLDLGGRDLEYSLWWLLDAPQSGFRLQVLRGFGTEAVPPASFRPCAVLCTRCGNRARYMGLPLQFDGGFLRLYAANGAE